MHPLYIYLENVLRIKDMFVLFLLFSSEVLEMFTQTMYSSEKMIWSPADFVRLPTDKEMISL